MPRTTASLVGGIIELDLSIDTAPFILAASALVDDVAALVSYFTPARLELIETWLAAHFYCMRDPRPVSEHAGSVSATYQSKIDLNLHLSHYGQMAMVLDTSGTLRDLMNKKPAEPPLPPLPPQVVSVTWVGT